MFDKHANLKYKFGNRHFGAEDYYVSTVGLNEATIRKYIQEQEKHDIAIDKLSVKEYEGGWAKSLKNRRKHYKILKQDFIVLFSLINET